jgi:cytochrome c1
MTTPIRPSLAQMLNPQGTAAAAAKPAVAESTSGFASALAAQKAFFQQVTTPKITPPTYTAADVANATGTMTTGTRVAEARVTPQITPAATTQDVTQPLRRPGSYLNIVV